MKTLFFIAVLFVCAWHLSPYKADYTVRFINKTGDTSYLMNRKGITYKEAEEVAKHYYYKAQPVKLTERDGK